MFWHPTEQKYSRIKKLQDLLLARSGGTTYIPITIVTILMFCIASWLIFWPETDPARYQCYALTFWFGSHATALLPQGQCFFLGIVKTQSAFHMLPIEYPPLTLLLFSLPLLAPLAYYQFAFMLIMALTAVVIYWILQRYGPHGSAALFALYIFIGACALAQTRYDLLPAMMMLLCVIAAERKHWTAAYIALAFGILLKIYPIMLLPPLFIIEQQSKGRFHVLPDSFSIREIPQQLWYTLRAVAKWQWKNCCILLAILLGVTGIFALFNFNNAVISQLSYFLHRPIQVESTGGTLLWLARIFGIPWQGIVYDFGSINIVSGLTGIVSAISTVCLVLGYLYVLGLLWFRKLDIAQTAIALTLIFIATGKVFSPQYLIWLIPLLAYVGAFDTFWLFFWGSISLQTTIIYAFFNSRISTGTSSITMPSGFFEMAGVRNVFFVLLTLAYLFNWFQARQRRALPQLLYERDVQSLLHLPQTAVATTAQQEHEDALLIR